MTLLLAPPPPPRRSRQPFITAFISEVFTFLGARDLLVCRVVSKLWKEESNALSLWRNLLLSSPNTAASAYSGLTLKGMQRLALRTELPVSEAQTKMYLPPRFKVNNDASGRERVPNQMGLHHESDRSSHVPTQCFSSGIQLRMPLVDINTSPDCRIATLEENVKNIRTHLERFKRRLHDYLESLRVLNQQAPNSLFVQFCDGCAKKLKELEMFEEIIVNSFCRSFPDVGLRGIRTFAHVEMATLSDVGSPTHLEWCKFKSLLPLDDSYFDYLDFLHTFSDFDSHRPESNALNEYSREQQLERFSALHAYVKGIIGRRSGEIHNIVWNEIVQSLPGRTLE